MSSAKRGAYDPTSYAPQAAAAKAKGTTVFTHNEAWQRNRAIGLAKELDPKYRNSFGKFIRECIASDVHDDPTANWFNFDGTGSMFETPRIFMERMPNMMSMLVKLGWMPQPQILFSQSCDYTDPVPFQLGQFEADNKIDGALQSMVLAGGGSGSAPYHEAYCLPLYVAAHHTDLSCVKRGRKGHMFMIGDELPNPHLTAGQIMDIFGYEAAKSLYTFDELLAATREKFHVHWICPDGTQHWRDSRIETPMRAIFGEDYHLLENNGRGAEVICEFAAGLIALYEGVDTSDMTDGLVNNAENPLGAAAASRALVTFAGSTNKLAKRGGSSSGDLVVETQGAVSL